VKLNWAVCRNRGCRYYDNGFAGTECLLGLNYDEIIKCQNNENLVKQWRKQI